MSTIYLTLLLSVMIAAILATHGAAAWRLDCSKFVFAPKCRGVAAKRSQEADMKLLEGHNFISKPTFRDIENRLSVARAPKDSSLSDSQGRALSPVKEGSVQDDWVDHINGDDTANNDIINLLRALKLSDKQILASLVRLSEMKDSMDNDDSYDTDFN